MSVMLLKSYLPEYTDSITRNDITWTFDEPVEYGQFITGDYWVVGPVTINSVSPEATTTSGNDVNGTQINPANGAQGYDSRVEDAWGAGYNASLRESFPQEVAVNSSVVSTISRDPTVLATRPCLQSAEVLTVLSEAPASTCFRPGLVGGTKTLYDSNDIDWDLLPDLTETTNCPSAATVASEYTSMLERPWILHPEGWTHRFTMPYDNSPSYHRDVAMLLAEASTLCMIDWGDREDLVIGLIQVAIDYYTMQVSTGEGAYNYRWPIIFAGMMLGNDNMRDLWVDENNNAPSYHERHIYYRNESVRITPSDVIPSDDNWTRYYDRTGITPVPCYGGDLEGDQSGHEELHPDEWDWIADAGYSPSTAPIGGYRSESYRRFHSSSIPGFALCVHAFGATTYLDFDSYMDYADRWMDETPAILLTYGYGEGETVHPVQTSSNTWIDEMWEEYREDY